ncbi:LysR family transcriptional regulator [Leucobacter sp. cx-42]|uniref:LysR family transcriptional regulator n=1 Tax=unclassified Leucobacter TaxID=2621730 RepID=UPI00165DFC89|nr:MULTISPECIES: LysR family transcriptional regulator [unclassified Leucobacter]MBC9953746.1 LysR family transcriptional regulator [Leucobacter sp. cx-42]
MHVSTQSLRVFLSVVEEGSLSKAARVLYMSQPSVSVHVRDLETSLGVHLLDRSPMGVTPTAAGTALAERAREVMSIIGGLEAEVAAAEGMNAHRLVVGATGTLGQALLPNVLAGFADTHPDLRVELRVGNAKQVAQWVIDREVAIGICAGKIDQPQLRSKAVLDESLTLVALPSHPLVQQQSRGEAVRPEQLAGERFLMRELGSATRSDQDLALAMWGCSKAMTWTVSGAESALECVRAGVGISLISEHVVARELNEGRLAAIELDQMPPRRPVTVIWVAGTTLRPVEEELIETLDGLTSWTSMFTPPALVPAP